MILVGTRTNKRALIVVAFLTSAAMPQEPTSASGIVTAIVQTDLACLFAVDGRAPKKSEPARPASIKLSAGSHTVIAVTADGQDSWRGTFTVIRTRTKFLIPMMEARCERLEKEARIAKLRDQLERSKQEVSRARDRNASNPSDPDTIVNMITALEQKFAKEQALAAKNNDLAHRLAASYQPSSTTPGAIADLANLGLRLGAIQRSKLHSERANQILKCISDLTVKLGGGWVYPLLGGACSLEESQSFGATHTTGWSDSQHDGELRVSPNHVQWIDRNRPKDDFSISCEDVKRIGTVRGLFSVADEFVDGDEFYVATRKKFYAFRAGNRLARENILEALHTACPQR